MEKSECTCLEIPQLHHPYSPDPLVQDIYTNLCGIHEMRRKLTLCLKSRDTCFGGLGLVSEYVNMAEAALFPPPLHCPISPGNALVSLGIC